MACCINNVGPSKVIIMGYIVIVIHVHQGTRNVFEVCHQYILVLHSTVPAAANTHIPWETPHKYCLLSISCLETGNCVATKPFWFATHWNPGRYCGFFCFLFFFQLGAYILQCGWYKTAILAQVTPNIICGSPMTKFCKFAKMSLWGGQKCQKDLFWGQS